MAKKAQKNLLLTLVAVVLSILTAVTFFIPTYKTADDSDGRVRVSACELCFISNEKAQDNAEEALIAGDQDEYLDNVFIFLTKAEDTELIENEYRPSALAGAWLHFVAFVASIIVAALLVINMLKDNLGLIAKFATILPVLLMIASLICSIVLVNKGDFDGSVKLTVCGNILGLITAIGAAVVAFIPQKKAKKANK